MTCTKFQNYWSQNSSISFQGGDKRRKTQIKVLIVGRRLLQHLWINRRFFRRVRQSLLSSNYSMLNFFGLSVRWPSLLKQWRMCNNREIHGDPSLGHRDNCHRSNFTGNLSVIALYKAFDSNFKWSQLGLSKLSEAMAVGSDQQIALRQISPLLNKTVEW